MIYFLIKYCWEFNYTYNLEISNHTENVYPSSKADFFPEKCKIKVNSID